MYDRTQVKLCILMKKQDVQGLPDVYVDTHLHPTLVIPNLWARYPAFMGNWLPGWKDRLVRSKWGKTIYTLI